MILGKVLSQNMLQKIPLTKFRECMYPGHHDTLHNDTQHNDSQHNNKKNATLSIIAFNCYIVVYAYCRNQVYSAECHFAECHFAECHFAECHFAECHFAQCHFDECRGAVP
jgi:hypothetical protein